MRVFFAALACVGLCAGQAFAQEGVPRGTFNAWGAYSHSQGGSTACYVMSVPTDMQPTSLNHGEIYFFLSRSPGQNPSYEPQFVASYNFQENSAVTVSVGDQRFRLFTRGNSAWIEDPQQAPQLVTAMRAGANMQVAARSGRGNDTRYAFSLQGVTAALNSIGNCS